MHNQFVHEEIKYPCDACDYLAILKGHKRRHKQSVHEGKKYLCDYLATEKGRLRTHKHFVHKGKKYPCDACDYLVTDKGHLRTQTICTRRKEICM